MAELSHSREASEVLSLFYDKKITVFVEGPDDIWFWSSLFKIFGEDLFHFEPTEGMGQLNKRIDEIIKDEAAFIVACDNDFSTFFDEYPKHCRIIRTYGYSIENTIYCPRILNIVAQKLARTVNSFLQSISDYIKDFETKSMILLNLDLSNQLNGKGFQLGCDNCSRYLKNPQSVYLDETKLKTHCDAFTKNFSAEELRESADKINHATRPVYSIIRGHFITSAAINWIKKSVLDSSGQRIQLSYDSLYSACVDNCHSCMEDCLQKTQYLESISVALHSLTGKN